MRLPNLSPPCSSAGNGGRVNRDPGGVLAQRLPLSRLQRQLHQAGPRQHLEWVYLRRPQPRGTLFTPPLIGGGGLLSIRHLRRLAQSDYDLLSFNYAGHGGSTPHFSLGATLRDTRRMMALAINRSRRRRLPLFGMGLCYGGIPLLRAAWEADEPLRGIVLINALPRLFTFNLVRTLFAHPRIVGRAPGESANLRRMLRAYADRLFPNIPKNLSRFGILERRRIRLWRTLWEALTRNPLRGVCLETTPVLSLYSPHDPLLSAYRLFHPGGRYEDHIRRICPKATFVVLNGDHFLSAPGERRKACRAIVAFLKGRVPERPGPDRSAPLNASCAENENVDLRSELERADPTGGGHRPLCHGRPAAVRQH